MKIRIIGLFMGSFGLGLLLFSGCATGKLDRQLDEKLAQENPRETRKIVRRELADLIKAAPGLSEEQRGKLSALKKTALSASDELREKSYKLRSVLIKDVLSPNYDPDEVALLKNRLKNLEHERLTVFLSTVRDTNTILGRWASRQTRENADNDFYETQAIYEMVDPYGL